MKKRTILRTLFVTLASSIAFFGLSLFKDNSSEFWYLLPNLFLATIPLIMCVLIGKRAAKKDALTFFYILIWLLFLPNTFYIFTDFVHLGEMGRVAQSSYGTTAPINIFDVVMLASFSINGFLIGIISMLWMKKHLIGKFRRKHINWFMYGSLVAACFGLYLGRNVRLNSWDVIARPLDLIIGLGSVFFSPSKWGDVLLNIGMYMLFITPFYYLAEQIDQNHY